MGRGDLTNEQWARLEPLLPTGIKPGRPPKWSKRQLIDGIRWRTRTGAPWRDVPARYGPWMTLHDRLVRWRRDGTWDRLLAHAQTKSDAVGELVWVISVDATISRAHQHAAGARKRPAKAEPKGGTRPRRTIPARRWAAPGAG